MKLYKCGGHAPGFSVLLCFSYNYTLCDVLNFGQLLFMKALLGNNYDILLIKTKSLEFFKKI